MVEGPVYGFRGISRWIWNIIFIIVFFLCISTEIIVFISLEGALSDVYRYIGSRSSPMKPTMLHHHISTVA